MIDIKEGTKILASLAVFRKLYDNEKDIYGVISEFLNSVIISEGKYQFSSKGITDSLNITFDFSIPESVVITSLGRLNYLTKDHGIYIVDSTLQTSRKNLINFQDEVKISNDSLIENLFSFIALEKNINLNFNEKEKIVHSFCSFLLDDFDNEEYSKFISGFVIKNKHDDAFRKKLNNIREGVILYSGLKYNNNLSEVGSWKSEIIIYVDTEILFHFAGYNGKLFKCLFDDFFKYVQEINNKAKQKLIRLKYFKEVKDEIDIFFTKAKYIVEGKDKPNPKMIAMSSIVEGCKFPGDIIDKKSDFYLLLKNNGIDEEESTNYFKESDYKYNIVDNNAIEVISNEFGFDITEYLRFLNFISIHRKEANLNNFENIGCILLTGNSKTNKIAWHKLIKKEGVVPLATTLHWITNKFWFKLNKGFGNGALPKSFDIITKAQIILSSVLNESVGKKYDELQFQFKAGIISEDQAKARIINLRHQVRKPEEIERDAISSIFHVISEDSLEHFIKEQELFKNEAAKQAEENIKLKGVLDIHEKTIKEEKTAKTLAQIELIRASIDSKEKLLKEKKETVDMLENQKNPIDKIANKIFRNFKIIFGSIFILYYLVTYFLIWKYNWEKIEPWTFIIGTFPIILTLLYLFISEKDWNPKHFLKRKKDLIKNQEYKKFNFNINRLHVMIQEIAQLEEEIKSQKIQEPLLYNEILKQ